MKGNRKPHGRLKQGLSRDLRELKGQIREQQLEVRLEKWVKKDQNGLPGPVGKTSTPGLSVEYIVGLRVEAGDHEKGCF